MRSRGRGCARACGGSGRRRTGRSRCWRWPAVRCRRAPPATPSTRLLAEGLAEQVGGVVQPAHDLIGRAAVELLPDAERRALHAELAEGALDDGDAAVHWQEAGEPARAVATALAAAGAAGGVLERARFLAVAREKRDRPGGALPRACAPAVRSPRRVTPSPLRSCSRRSSGTPTAWRRPSSR